MASLSEWMSAAREAFGLDPDSLKAARLFGVSFAALMAFSVGPGAWFGLFALSDLLRVLATVGAAIAAFVAGYIYIRLHF